MSKISKWVPSNQDTLNWFVGGLAFLDEIEADLLKSETLKILERCTNPNAASGSLSVLVVGEVQSGKTLSFTSLIAAARDSGYKITVLLAGTKQNLRDQTFARLENDLKVNNAGGAAIWNIHKAPTSKSKPEIWKALRTWDDPKLPPKFRQSIIIVGMKTSAGIRKIMDLLNDIHNDFGGKVPVLFVDDEADQASLNTAVSRQDVSATYAAVTNLRNSTACHSYVMYTATSQALLLLEFADHLSPDSVVVLESRPSYVGGEELFSRPSSRYVQEIPASEINAATVPGPSDGPPKTLLSSLAYFFITMAIAQKREKPRPVSMLIHPASTKQTHEAYRRWVVNITTRWLTQLHGDEANDAFESDFLASALESAKTSNLHELFGDVVSNLPDRYEFIKELRYWIENVEVRVVNSETQANQIKTDEWGSKPGWIVIGGAKLERGFTIENLVVTYMPRGVGIGAADTIQQRGRFFGHKRSYIDLLRGWINIDTRRAFESIVETENQMRRSLSSVENEEKPLREWRREFLLSPGMQATRRAVISLSNSQFNLRAGFAFKQSYLYHPGLGSDFEFSKGLVGRFKSRAVASPLDNRQASSKHMVTSITLEELREILLNWPVAAAEKSTRDFLLVAIGFYAEVNPHLNAHIYFMNNLETRERGLNPSDASKNDLREWRITNLHQGRDPGGVYAGDATIRTLDAISIQVHRIRPKTASKTYPEVLALAVSWPTGFDKIVLIQN